MTVPFEHDTRLFRPVIKFTNITSRLEFIIHLFRFSTKYKI